MAADQGTLESDLDNILEVDVILTDGTVNGNYSIMKFNSVLQEKARIWNTETRVGPPELQELILVLLFQNGKEQVMDDALPIGDYVDDFSESQIKFVKTSLAMEREGRVANPSALNAIMK